jgi:hypothetical protein
MTKFEISSKNLYTNPGPDMDFLNNTKGMEKCARFLDFCLMTSEQHGGREHI